MTDSIFTILLFVPMFLIVLMANLADKQRLAGGSGTKVAGLTYALHLLIFGTIAVGGAVLHAIAISMRTNDDLRESFLAFAGGDGGEQVEGILHVLERLDVLGLGIWVPAAAAPLFLLPAVRRLLADVTRIDARSTVHAVAASFVMLVVLNLSVTLAIGLDTLADLSEATETDGGTLLVSLWVQQITFALWAAVGVGWLTRRKWLQALERLGLLVPRPAEVAVGIGTGLISVAIILALEIVAEAAGWGLDEDVQRLTRGAHRAPARVDTGNSYAGSGCRHWRRNAVSGCVAAAIWSVVHQYSVCFAAQPVWDHPLYTCGLYRRNYSGAGTESVQHINVRNRTRVV